MRNVSPQLRPPATQSPLMEQKTPAQQRKSWVFLSTKNHLRNKAWRASGPSEVASWASVVVPAELLVLPLLVFLSETFLLSNLQGSVKKISSLYKLQVYPTLLYCSTIFLASSLSSSTKVISTKVGTTASLSSSGRAKFAVNEKMSFPGDGQKGAGPYPARESRLQKLKSFLRGRIQDCGPITKFKFGFTFISQPPDHMVYMPSRFFQMITNTSFAYF